MLYVECQGFMTFLPFCSHQYLKDEPQWCRGMNALCISQDKVAYATTTAKNPHLSGSLQEKDLSLVHTTCSSLVFGSPSTPSSVRTRLMEQLLPGGLLISVAEGKSVTNHTLPLMTA